jgi:hypothetical protein
MIQFTTIFATEMENDVFKARALLVGKAILQHFLQGTAY